MNNDVAERENVLQDLNQLSGEGNVESMLLVEKGLRKLSSLKVGEAVAIAMAQQRWTSSTKSGLRDDLKLPFKGRNLAKAFGFNCGQQCFKRENTVVVGVGIPSQERDNAQGHQGSQHPCR
ncbi:hypothetical protein Vadar_002387 [Vaccinium darrowii]|uniref:Uncharacterized protein n=1 Tax=Vaccinium darrowii TaxID=229202 RepID=A0ACB7ZHM8_9ERIC|nr:hypothetical protein Vadar_002387 [Vaccinium darrowii]